MPKAASSRKANVRSKPLGKSRRAGTDKREEGDRAATSAPRTNDRGTNYVLFVQLKDVTNPEVTRTLSVPSDFTFQQLNDVLIVAFGWAGCHDSQFRISEAGQGLRLSPFADIPLRPNPKGFHPGRSVYEGRTLLHLLRTESGWDDEDDNEQLMRTFKLHQVFENEEHVNKTLVMWEYDLGDGWEYSVHFVGKGDQWLRRSIGAPDDMPVFCFSGQGHPVAEDCGGVEGWEDLKAVFATRGPDVEGRAKWYKRECANGNPKGLNPYQWDIQKVNDALKNAGSFDQTLDEWEDI